MNEVCNCSSYDKLISSDESFEFEGEELKPYCQNCYDEICDEFNIAYCVFCGKQFNVGNNGNELGFCIDCQKQPDFPYDLDRYYTDLDSGKTIFKGFETMSRGILERYKK